MKTKIIPFDIELAKKIQAREIEGKIKTKCGNEVRILCFDLIDPKNVSFPIVSALYSDKNVKVVRFTEYGRYSGAINSDLDLVLEVLDNEQQFKPFDKVLVRMNDGQVWHCDFYSYTDSIHGVHYCIGHYGEQILPYEGNEHLVGTTDKPKEE